MRLVGSLVVFLASFTTFLAIFFPFPDKNKYFQLIICDVGQGDAVLIQKQRFQLLIDVGRDEKVVGCLKKHLPFGDNLLEVVVLTHPDLDHIGGLNHVFSAYRIGELWMTQIAKNNDDFKQIYESVSRKKDQGMLLKFPLAGEQISLLPKLQVLITSPRAEQMQKLQEEAKLSETGLWDSLLYLLKEGEDVNDLSIGTLFNIAGVTFVTQGDLSANMEMAIANRGMIPDVDMQKASHHGSKTSSNKTFLNKIRPEYTFISSGLNNQYGHPSPEVLANFGQIGAKIIKTSEDGDIIMSIDGETGEFWRN